MHMRNRKGPFCVFTSSLNASSQVRRIERLGVELGERVEVAELVLGGRRAAVPREQPLVHHVVPGGGDDGGRRRHQLGIDLAGFGLTALVQLGTAGLGGRVVALDRQGGGEQAAQLRPEVVLAGHRIAEIGDDRSQQRPHPRLQRRVVVVVDEPAEAAQPEHDGLPDGEFALAAEALDEGQVVHRGQASGDDLVPRVVDEVVALERVERTEHVTRDPPAQLLVVGDAVEAVATGVDDDRVAGVGEGDPRRGRAVVEQHRRHLVADADADRHEPCRGRVGAEGVSVEGEALLPQDDVVPVERRADQRVARLPDPRVHHPPYRFTALLLERVPQIVGLGVGVLVQREVVAHPLPKALLAEVLLEHAQQRPALLVGEHVEHALAVGGRPHLVLDRPGAGE